MGPIGWSGFWCWRKLRPPPETVPTVAPRHRHLLSIACAFGAASLLASCQSGSDSGSQSRPAQTAEPSPPSADRSIPSAPPAPRASPVLVDTDSLSVTMPSGWQLQERRSNLITLTTERGALTLGASALDQPQTPGELLQQDLADARKRDPNASICAGPQTQGIPNGPADGQVAVICYVYPPVGGSPSFQAAEVWFEGVNSDATIDYAIRLLMPVSTAAAFEREAVPVIRSVRWKVYSRSTVPSFEPAPPPPHQQLCFPSSSGILQCVA